MLNNGENFADARRSCGRGARLPAFHPRTSVARMPRRANPLKLNSLQLKTLTVLQALAEDSRIATRLEGSDDVFIGQLPDAHGDHFHIASYVVLGRDATGVRNPSVWSALERKGLIRDASPISITLTGQGVAYDTGLYDRILLKPDH